MTTDFIVLVSKENDGNYGEVILAAGIHEAERLIEERLERGLHRDSLRLLAGTEVSFTVTQKPVVSAVEQHPAAEETAGEAVTQSVSEPLYEREPVAACAAQDGGAGEGSGERPYWREGMQFSTAFGRP